MRRIGLAVALLSLPVFAAEAPTPPPAPGGAVALSSFRLFPDLSQPPPLHIDAIVRSSENLRIRQPGDPDSVVSPGGPGASREVRFLPAFEINDILLKAYKPDPTLGPADNRFRAAGAFTPLDEHGRPYQFRFGARLVW